MKYGKYLLGEPLKVVVVYQSNFIERKRCLIDPQITIFLTKYT